MHAEQLNIPNARIENAKLLYRQGKLDTALNILDPGEVAVSNLLARQSKHRTDVTTLDNVYFLLQNGSKKLA